MLSPGRAHPGQGAVTKSPRMSDPTYWLDVVSGICSLHEHGERGTRAPVLAPR